MIHISLLSVSNKWKHLSYDSCSCSLIILSQLVLHFIQTDICMFLSIFLTLSPLWQMRKHLGNNFAIGLFITIAFFAIAVRQILARKTRYNQQGSVADLVKRGQLRSDRRGMYGSSNLCIFILSLISYGA